MRELKLVRLEYSRYMKESRPLRGARIETMSNITLFIKESSRAPYGVRELKLSLYIATLLTQVSRPLRGARIET